MISAYYLGFGAPTCESPRVVDPSSDCRSAGDDRQCDDESVDGRQPQVAARRELHHVDAAGEGPPARRNQIQIAHSFGAFAMPSIGPARILTSCLPTWRARAPRRPSTCSSSPWTVSRAPPRTPAAAAPAPRRVPPLRCPPSFVLPLFSGIIAHWR